MKTLCCQHLICWDRKGEREGGAQWALIFLGARSRSRNCWGRPSTWHIGPYSGQSKALIIHWPPPPYFPFCRSVAELTSCQYQLPGRSTIHQGTLQALLRCRELNTNWFLVHKFKRGYWSHLLLLWKTRETMQELLMNNTASYICPHGVPACERFLFLWQSSNLGLFSWTGLRLSLLFIQSVHRAAELCQGPFKTSQNKTPIFQQWLARCVEMREELSLWSPRFSSFILLLLSLFMWASERNTTQAFEERLSKGVASLSWFNSVSPQKLWFHETKLHQKSFF